ncbi:dirigent protein-like, partial [Tasmannia lanceolata]|uniref:dirigent protein-like n=1 Tax=Tasmannia lanceolata TaxID=3420 RepID=UPI004062C582
KYFPPQQSLNGHLSTSLSFPCSLSSPLSYKATPSPHHHQHHKALYFSLYQHETINKTGFIIFTGVAGPAVTLTTAPIGSIFTFQDPLMTTANNSSRVLGIVEGTSITSGLDGLQGITMAKITLNLKGYKGSISYLGVVHNLKPSDLSVVGGTGNFLFVHGYVTTSPVNVVGLTATFKIEFHLYWPPFPVHQSS